MYIWLKWGKTGESLMFDQTFPNWVFVLSNKKIKDPSFIMNKNVGVIFICNTITGNMNDVVMVYIPECKQQLRGMK